MQSKISMMSVPECVDGSISLLMLSCSYRTAQFCSCEADLNNPLMAQQSAVLMTGVFLCENLIAEQLKELD